MIDNNQRKKIMHRRWIIIAIIALIVITWLGLWTFIFQLFAAFLVLLVAVRIFKWVTGMDIDDHNLREVNKYRAKHGLPPVNSHGDQENNHEVSDTLWDIFTLNQMFNHHDKN
ncbi:hypothetical protein ACLUXM_08555 [Limosilactobacillus reuteri subsp. suis]